MDQNHDRDQQTAEHPRAGAMHAMDSLSESEAFRRMHDVFELQPSDDGENLHIKCHATKDCPGQWVLPLPKPPEFKSDAERRKFAEGIAARLVADLTPHMKQHELDVTEAAAKSPS